jgi:hypothetical protein
MAREIKIKRKIERKRDVKKMGRRKSKSRVEDIHLLICLK